MVQFIPVFTLAIFYNLDLEMNPGSAMAVNGSVHGNKNIYVTGAGTNTPLVFWDIVEAVQQVNRFPSPLDSQNTSRTGNVVFNITNNNPISNAAPLYLGISVTNNPAAILDVPPAGIDPISSTGQAYLYNQADLVITNSNTNGLAVYYQNFSGVPAQLLVAMDVTNINVITHTTNISYSFVTNVTFYDYRESKPVKAIQLDVAKFIQWLTNRIGQIYNSLNTSGATSKGHGINLIHLYNGITNDGSQLPAVRVVNGAQLPTSGLTVTTPFPLYVEGNYNITTDGVNFSTALGDTTNTRPAALMGDAVTILSANWVDTATSSGNTRTATATTINAACLEGIVPSDGTHYSGGVENFLRLLENWGGLNPLTYNGSIVVLFPSQYATSPWGGSYYSPPVRRWGFDLNFINPAKLPPGTPMVRNYATP